MRHLLFVAVTSSLTLLGPTLGLTECVDTVSPNSSASKDGTKAPMEGAKAQEQPGPASGTTTTNSEIATKSPRKDGSNVPLSGDAGVAASGQDAQAQQQGGKTAAETAQKC